MFNEHIKEEIRDLLLIKLQECKLKPYGGAIYGDAAEYITDALMDDVVGDLLRERDGEIQYKERFAEQEGFTPDCSPYYIALQYKYQKEVAERALRNRARKYVDLQGCPTWDIAILVGEIVVPNDLKQAEKELSEGKK